MDSTTLPSPTDIGPDQTIAQASRVLPHPSERPPGVIVGARRCMHTKLRIVGLTCAAEAAGIERHLFHQPGVIHVMVNPLTEIAYVAFDPDRTHPATLRRCIEEAGFGVDAR
jgi:copper chaperone CopZ